MYSDEVFIATKRPEAIASYDAIVIPFDRYVWFFTFGCIVAQFVLLVAMQNLWSILTDTSNPKDFLFEGWILCNCDVKIST